MSHIHLTMLIMALLICTQNKSMDLILKKHEEILEKINKSKVLRLHQKENIAIIDFSNVKEKTFSAPFYINFYNKAAYLTLIIDHDKTLDQLGKYYGSLFNSLPTFRRALQDDAAINACDKRYKPLMFTISAPDGTICDVSRPIKSPCLEKNQKTVIIPAPYATNTQDFTVYQMAHYNGNVDIMSELISQYPKEFSSQEKLNVESLLQQRKKDEKKLQNAQQSLQIPTFQADAQAIVPHNDDFDSFKCWDNNSHILFAALINKGQVALKALTPPESWSCNYLGLDSLAAVYARVICLNEREGNNIIATFDFWKQHSEFAQHVLREITDFIEMQSYRNDNILMGNLVKLAECVIHKDDMQQRFDERYLALLLSFCVTKIQTSDTGEKERYYKSAYNALFDLLTKEEEGKSFLKNLCNEEYNKALLPTMVWDIKVFMQNTLLKNVLVRTFSSGRNPLLTKDAAGEVAARWQPDEAFKGYFRKTKNAG